MILELVIQTLPVFTQTQLTTVIDTYYLDRLIKPRNEDFLLVQRAIADHLSKTRNKIELNFGYHKARFESQSGKKGLYKIPACV
jgi:hypothetical protein